MIFAGFSGIIVNYVVFILLWTPYFIYSLYAQRQLSMGLDTRPVIMFFILSLSLPTLAHPFAILAAGLYSQYGTLSKRQGSLILGDELSEEGEMQYFPITQ